MSGKVHGASNLGSDAAAISLVAAISCALAGDALASSPPPAAKGADVSARIAALVQQINGSEPALVRDLGAGRKFVQWRN